MLRAAWSDARPRPHLGATLVWAVLLPPVAVLRAGPARLLLPSLLLTACLWIPGVIYALTITVAMACELDAEERLYFLTVVAPPLAVRRCGLPHELFLNLLLCLCGWLPGVIHASHVAAKRMSYGTLGAR